MSSSLNISSATSSTQQAQWSQANNPFQQLSQALSSGNLSAAQQAYSQLQQNAPQGASQISQSGQGSSGQSAFAALGQALQSGNLTSAQSAFSQIQQSAQGHHHHHRGGAPAASTTTASSAPTGTTGTTLNVTA